MSYAGFKQLRVNAGYYINVAGVGATFYQNNGTDAAPTFAQHGVRSTVTAVSTILGTAGSAIFRDHGKTLTSANRTFRKVQLMSATGSTYGGATVGTDAVGGSDVAPTNYLTGYIELPGSGGASSGLAGTAYTAVARLG